MDQPSIDSSFEETSVMQAITGIVSEVLGVQSMGVGDNLFESGLDSLSAVIISTVIENQLGVKVPIGVIFECATIRGLANDVLLRKKIVRVSHDNGEIRWEEGTL